MWRRVASQSPDRVGASGEMEYKMAYAAISDLLFSGHSLSGHERNSLFLHCGNQADGFPKRFANASFATGFGVEDDTRGVGLTDWDQDGDLDVWITNRTAPRLRFLRNDLKPNLNWLAVKLEGTTSNRDAIGAHLTLTLPSGRKLYRTRRCGEGFLTQNSAWIHFGLGEETAGPLALSIYWPDGKTDTLSNLTVGNFWHIRQGSPAKSIAIKQAPVLVANKATGKPWEAESRTVLVGRLPMPRIRGEVVQRANPAPKGTAKGKLLVFFAAWCQPCLKEMAELVRIADDLKARGIVVQALEVPGVDGAIDSAKTKAVLKRLRWPFAVTRLDANSAGALDIFHRSFLSLRRELPLPASFLVDGKDELAIVYRGLVTGVQVLADCALLGLPAATIRAKHLPFAGIWANSLPEPAVTNALIAWKREGYLSQGQAYLERYLPVIRKKLGTDLASLSQLTLLCEHLVDFARLQNNQQDVARSYELALDIHPNYVPALLALGNQYGRGGDLKKAVSYVERAFKIAPKDPNILESLGIVRIKQARFLEARQFLYQAIVANPRNLQLRMNYCNVLLQLKDWKAAGQEIRVLWQAMPGQQQVSSLVQKLRPHLKAQEEASLKADLQAVLRASRPGAKR